ncbi:hypothetical protein RND71_042411 [Anisodus tanguticus]|uniref:Uncharacterized protein n=1 Tax=Anisodus tanguticus TaxID=243964 RepID=A0AAE1QRF9_9SOLA|nr:hypothetical protein RND71_042411 [Anisodus tanguticus]
MAASTRRREQLSAKADETQTTQEDCSVSTNAKKRTLDTSLRDFPNFILSTVGYTIEEKGSREDNQQVHPKRGSFRGAIRKIQN